MRRRTQKELQLKTGNKLFQAEQAAFHYSELSRENISSVMKECIGFVLLERAHCKLFMGGCTLCRPYFVSFQCFLKFLIFMKILLHEYNILRPN